MNGRAEEWMDGWNRDDQKKRIDMMDILLRMIVHLNISKIFSYWMDVLRNFLDDRDVGMWKD